MTTPVRSIFVATPAYGGVVNTGYHRAMMQFHKLCLDGDIGFESMTLDGCSMITHARNECIAKFLHDTEHSHLLFIDPDIGFNASDILTMFRYPDHEVSAVLCPRRGYNWTIIRDAVRQHPDIDPDALPHLGGQYTGMFQLPAGVNSMTVGDEPIEVASVGAGIMLIARGLLERMLRSPDIAAYHYAGLAYPVTEFFRAGVSDGVLQGEDIYFCNLVRAHGARIHAFPGFVITQSGMHTHVGDLPGITAHYDGPVQTSDPGGFHKIDKQSA